MNHCKKNNCYLILVDAPRFSAISINRYSGNFSLPCPVESVLDLYPLRGGYKIQPSNGIRAEICPVDVAVYRNHGNRVGLYVVASVCRHANGCNRHIPKKRKNVKYKKVKKKITHFISKKYLPKRIHVGDFHKLRPELKTATTENVDVRSKK